MSINITATLSREEIEFAAARVLKGIDLAKRHGANPSTFRDYQAQLATLRAAWKDAKYDGTCDHLTFAHRNSMTLLVSVRDECVRCGTGVMWK